MNDYYKYEDSKNISLQNKKGIVVHFTLGTVWEHAGQEKIIIHEENENVKIKLSKKSFDELKKKSKQVINPQEDLFEINESFQKEDDLLIKINSHVQQFFSELEHIQIASNFKEIKKELKTINEHIKIIHQSLPINFDKVDKKLKFSIEFFNQKSIHSFLNKNNPSIEKPYSYVKEIENNALTLVAEGIKWVEERHNLYMLKTCISDFIKLNKVAYLLNKGEVLKAGSKSQFNDYLKTKLPPEYIEQVLNVNKEELKKLDKFAKEKLKYSEVLKVKI